MSLRGLHPHPPPGKPPHHPRVSSLVGKTLFSSLNLPGDILLSSECSSELPCPPLPRCSQDAVGGQVLSELFTNRKDNIPLKFSEDCLYLNIYTPADLTKNSRLPVSRRFQSSGVDCKRGKAAWVGAVLGTPGLPNPPQPDLVTTRNASFPYLSFP